VGSHDPEVEIAKANAQSEVARAQAQLAMMKALVDALTRLGTPMPLCLSTDGVTIEACKERAK
jgi:hypothetical protein